MIGIIWVMSFWTITIKMFCLHCSCWLPHVRNKYKNVCICIYSVMMYGQASQSIFHDTKGKKRWRKRFILSDTVSHCTFKSCSNLLLLHFWRQANKKLRKVNTICTSGWDQELTAVLSHHVMTRWSSVIIYSSIKWIPYLLTSSHGSSCSFTCQQVATDNDTIWKICSQSAAVRSANTHRQHQQEKSFFLWSV